MARRAFVRVGVVVAGALALLAFSSQVRSAEDPRTALKFLENLREKGLYDQAIWFIDALRADPELPADLKAVLDYHEGRTRIDEASHTGDLARKRDLLDQARGRLEAFAAEQPHHPLAREGLVQIGRMLVFRGHLALLLADDTRDAGPKSACQADARAAFSQARDAFARAVEQLSKAHKNYSGFIPKGDPRLEERDKAYSALLDAMLQQGISVYELAQTFPAASAQRTSHLSEALKQFDDLYKNYRTQMAGLTAQMWQAKCYEEQGKIGEAIGIYKELLRQPDPRLRPLQRFVGYFYIVALAKRNDHALAADEAERWLETYNRREEQRSQEGLGVLLELAKNIDAQMSLSTDKIDRQQAARKIVDAVSQVIRYASPHKNEALALLRKYKPSAATRAEEVVRMSYDDAVSAAEEAIAAHDWERAIGLLRAATQKVDPRHDTQRVNKARFQLAYCYFMNKQYYEADVLAEHLARRYPQWGLAPKAGEIGMQALAEAYNAPPEIDRRSDLERLIDLARYTADAWPDHEQADLAHLNLGQIYQGRGQYDQAKAEFAAVRDRSPKKIEAQTRLGSAHWASSRLLDRSGQKDKADAESQAAIILLEKSLSARREAGAGPTDAGFMGNAADLAVALTETGRAADALKMLAPVINSQTQKTGAPFARLMEANLLAQINSGQVELAIASMKALEQSGSTTGRAQLYFKLGKLLERELSRLEEKKDGAELKAMRQAYHTFLTALAESKSSQTYDALEWAGESLLTLGAGADAEKVLRKVLADAIASPAFRDQPGGKEKVLRTKLKLAAALRLQAATDKKKLDESASMVEEVLSEYPRYLEPQIEKGMLLEAQAQTGQSDWTLAVRHWQDLGQRISGTRPRPLKYYDAWYHAAWSLTQQGEKTKARQILGGIMRLSPGVGSPEMKLKYEQLMEKLK